MNDDFITSSDKSDSQEESQEMIPVIPTSQRVFDNSRLNFPSHLQEEQKQTNDYMMYRSNQFQQKPFKSLIEMQQDPNDSNYINQTEPLRSQQSNIGGPINTQVSASASQNAIQKNFTFNDTVSSQPKQFSSQRSNFLIESQKKLSLFNQQDRNNGQNIFSRPQIIEKAPFMYQQQQNLVQSTPSKYSSQEGSEAHNQAQITNSLYESRNRRELLEQKGQRTLLQRFQKNKPQEATQIHQHHNISVSSTKSIGQGGTLQQPTGNQGISQSLMYLNKNREKLLMTSSQDSFRGVNSLHMSKGNISKSPQQNVNFQGINDSSSYKDKFSRTPTQPISRIGESTYYDIDPYRSSSVQKQIQNLVQESDTVPTIFPRQQNPQMSSFTHFQKQQLQLNSPADLHNTLQNSNPFFINTRNFKKKNSAQIPLSNIIWVKRNPMPNPQVSVPSTMVVDDYNPQYSKSKYNNQLHALKSVQKLGRNYGQLATLSPNANQQVYSTSKKQAPQSRLPLAQNQFSHLGSQANQTQRPNNLSIQSLKTEIERVRNDINSRMQAQREREQILNQIDQNLVTSSQQSNIYQTTSKVEQDQTENYDDAFNGMDSQPSQSEDSNFQTSSDDQPIDLQYHIPYSQAKNRVSQIAGGKKTKVHEYFQRNKIIKEEESLKEEDNNNNNVILITADDENYGNYGSPNYFTQTAITRPRNSLPRILPQNLNTESSNLYTSESGNTRFNQDTQVGTTPDQMQMQNINLTGNQTSKIKRKKLVRIHRHPYQDNNFVVREISMSGCSSSKNPSFSQGSQFGDSRLKAQTPLYCCRGFNKCAIF